MAINHTIIAELADRPSRVELAESSSRLWLRWIVANALGELVGLGAVAGIATIAGPAFLAEESFPGHLLFSATMILAGAVEGFVVGMAQWLVLRRPFHSLHRRQWIGATVTGAVIAWALGMLPSLLMSGAAPDGSVPTTIDRGTIYLLAAAMGGGLGAILGFPQARVLGSHVERPSLWILGNILAWMVAMPVVFIGAGSIARLGVTLETIALGLETITLAGALCGAIHGAFLIRMIRSTGKDALT